jgi:hypothetical protein
MALSKRNIPFKKEYGKMPKRANFFGHYMRIRGASISRA